jgi:hypothetical protein
MMGKPSLRVLAFGCQSLSQWIVSNMRHRRKSEKRSVKRDEWAAFALKRAGTVAPIGCRDVKD